jgi:hypothetical protein
MQPSVLYFMKFWGRLKWAEPACHHSSGAAIVRQMN